MRIAIGADHAGFALKQHLVATLTRLGHQVDDLGTHSSEPVDYPEICASVARAVVEQRADRGIVIGGSGQGEQMAANKVRGARAALCNDLYTARLSRQHNDANVLALGGRIVALRPGRRDRRRLADDRRSKADVISAASTRSPRSRTALNGSEVTGSPVRPFTG